jgi:hypothetical protein
MVKSNSKPKVARKNVVIKKVVKTRAPKVKSNMKAAGPFGPVATIDTAPVSIGNTVRGSAPVITYTRDGVRVQGRDFLVTVPAIAAVDTNWQLAAACPLAPGCMVASGVRSFANAYSQYCLNGMAFHFITAESTGVSGNILLYPSKDRAAPGLNSLSQNFLPLVLSDQNAVIGPLWNNCSATYMPPCEWRPTDIFNAEELRHQAAGELFVFTKSAGLAAPGYVLVDYDITFMEFSVNPKTLTLPVARMKYTQCALVRTVANTIDTNATFSLAGGTLLDAVTTSAVPPGCVPGDIYKVILSLANNGLAGRAANTVLAFSNFAGGSTAITLTEGYTCYARVDGTGVIVDLFPDYISATAGVSSSVAGSTLVWQASFTANLQIQCFLSLVGSANPSILQSNF